MGGAHIKSFVVLIGEFSLHKSQFFKYLQLRNALFLYQLELTDLPEFNPLEVKLLMGPIGNGAISQLYRSLVIHSPDPLSDL